MELFTKFGINGYTLLAQTVNFLVVLLILWKFAYKPVLKMLRDRSKTIEKGLQDAERAKAALENAESTRADVLKNAEKEANALLTNARKAGEDLKTSMLNETKEQIVAMQEAAQKELQQTKATLIDSAKEEIADLVVTATEKILKEKVIDERNRQEVFDTITKISPRL